MTTENNTAQPEDVTTTIFIDTFTIQSNYKNSSISLCINNDQNDNTISVEQFDFDFVEEVSQEALSKMIVGIGKMLGEINLDNVVRTY